MKRQFITTMYPAYKFENDFKAEHEEHSIWLKCKLEIATL